MLDALNCAASKSAVNELNHERVRIAAWVAADAEFLPTIEHQD